MGEAMTGKSPLHVVGWLGRSGYQTVIHEAARKAAGPTSKLETKPQSEQHPVLEPART
jgi:hypothetical protein